MSTDQRSDHKLIGSSTAFSEVLDLLKRVADKGITTLILGESGTGKSYVARAIHEMGPRREGPFVKFNCAALPETLVESELFGHEKGSFTGADRRKLGRFETASSGTIFLDEIGNISHAVQTKLLRVIEEPHEFERVGGTQTLCANVHIITATNRDLKQAIREGSFRQDLYYRLNVIPIEMPPLRHRKADIPSLADHLLKRINSELDLNKSRFAPEAMRLLVDYDWPGNVRELESAVRRAAVLAQSDVIRIEDLRWLEGQRREVPTDDAIASFLRSARTGETPLQTIEREFITKVLTECNKQVPKAAQYLGITRADLLRLMKRHGLSGSGASIHRELPIAPMSSPSNDLLKETALAGVRADNSVDLTQVAALLNGTPPLAWKRPRSSARTTLMNLLGANDFKAAVLKLEKLATNLMPLLSDPTSLLSIAETTPGIHEAPLARLRELLATTHPVPTTPGPTILSFTPVASRDSTGRWTTDPTPYMRRRIRVFREGPLRSFALRVLCGDRNAQPSAPWKTPYERLMARAVVLEANAQIEDMRQLLTDSPPLDHEHEDLHRCLLLGVALDKLNYLDDALRQYDRILTRTPKPEPVVSLAAEFNRLVCLEKQGDLATVDYTRFLAMRETLTMDMKLWQKAVSMQLIACARRRMRFTAWDKQAAAEIDEQATNPAGAAKTMMNVILYRDVMDPGSPGLSDDQAMLMISSLDRMPANASTTLIRHLVGHFRKKGDVGTAEQLLSDLRRWAKHTGSSTVARLLTEAPQSIA